MQTATIHVGGVGVQMLCDGDAIMRMMANGKRWEPQTRAIWQTLLAEGASVIDVGAYTGVYAIASALMGAKVLALEPHPTNYARLCENAAINSVRIEALQVAASDHQCASVLLRTKHELERLSDTASMVDPWPHAVAVHAVRLDDLRLPSPVGLIKIDAEHHELSILAGARGTIMAHRPWVLVECLGPQAIRDVDGAMDEMRYSFVEAFDNRNRLYVGVKSSEAGREGLVLSRSHAN